MLNKNFQPTPSLFINCFDTYDIEDSRGVELNKYDPNKFEDLKFLIDEYFINGSAKNYGPCKKKALIDCLSQALNSDNYDFASIIEYDSNECFYLPDEWNIIDGRAFFKNILEIVKDAWAE
ncbi:hypothetical protein [Budvicia aquatica]|uniref:hypothetical protein n=1 Tax=Budvicia aquatica TaxID=82979 RepID=UPI002085DF0E|nr:hypothetical protein [Budvicia aquatica]GKX52721.1 hypothetical protein SOASR029_30300 [Budvicia aquatica]